MERVVADVLLVLQPNTGSEPVDEDDVYADDTAAEPIIGSDDSLTPTAGQYAQSRAMTRPQSQDMISSVFDHFVELSGDGRVGDDGCIRGGLALLGKKRVVVVASFKGHTPSTMQDANYGMSSPHGYRKALRLMKLAETFGLPVVTLVDTCGAFPALVRARRSI